GNALTGQGFDVSWTDQNNCNGPANGDWSDRLWISTSKTLDSSAMFLGQFTFNENLNPGQSVTRTQQVYAPGAAGTYYVIVQADADGGVDEGPNAADNTVASGGTVDVAVTPLPDLVVSSVTAPVSGVLSGTTVPVTYTVTNQGNASTQVPVWTDVVLMSQLPNLQLSPDALTNAGVFLEQPVFPALPQNVTALAPSQSYSQTVNVTLPFAASGTWYVYVLTDETYSNEILDKFLDPGPVRESNYVNNLGRSSGFTVSQSPTPDLLTTKVVAPSEAFSGQPMNVSWSVTNQGAGATNVSEWEDKVYMSTTQSLTSSAILLNTLNHQGVLEPGDSYTDSETVTLPVGISGPFYFIAQSNADFSVFEAGATANDIQSTTSVTTVNLTPPPQLSVAVTAPATALASHVLSVNYTVTNIGAGTTPSEIPPGSVVDPHDPQSPVTWTDTVYLAAGTTLNTSTDMKLGDITHEGVLNPGDSYTVTASFTLPNALSGTFHVFVVTDSAGQVFQTDHSQNTADAANATVVSSQPAQLVVTSATAPAAADPGQIIPMTWTVTNQGTGDTAVTYWVDKVYATTDSTLGPLGSNRVLIGTFPHNGLLNAGASYTDNVQVTVPYSLTGQYNLFVYTNAPVTEQEDGSGVTVSPPGGWVYETDPAKSVSAAIPIAISSKLAQLQVSGVTVTPSGAAVETGQQATVAWTINNTGSATTSSTHWYDDVYLSPTATFDANTAIYLGSAYDNNPLAAGASLNDSLSVLVPPSLAAGTYYFIVLADRPIAPPGASISNVQQTIDLVTEPNEFDSGGSAATSIALGPTPDLTTAITSAPTAALAGQTITVDWTVTNKGADTLPTPDNRWYDGVYLSLDTTFDPGADIAVGYVTHDGGLPGSESTSNSYSSGGDFRIPDGLAGNYYILVVADAQSAVFERSPNDRIAVTAQAADITLQPPVDLVAGTIAIPASATPGQPITVTYTVSNNSSIADPGDWTDNLYLSPTTTWQLADPLLGRVHHTGGIAANGSYSETLTAPLPGVTPGTYYVLLRTDALDQVPETDKVNNVDANDLSASAQISLDVPALTPGTTANPPTPATGTLTEGASAYYKLTVAADQTVQISLSDSDTLDVNELYASFGTVPSPSQFDFRGGSALSAGQTITIATTQAGTYYILVKNQSADGYNPSTNPNAKAAYSLTATIIDFSVTSLAPAKAGNAGAATIEIEGAKFNRATTFQLIDSQNNVTQATAIDVQDGSTAYVTFDLTGKAAGAYTVQATQADGTTTQLAGGLTVVAGQGANLQVDTSGRSFVRLNRENVFQVSYGNSGDADMPAPLIFITSPFDNPMSLTADEEYSPYNNLMFMGVAQDGPAGVLRPGAHYTVPVYWISGNTTDPFGFQVSVATAADTDPIALSDVEQWVQTSYYLLPNWNAVAAHLMKQVGPTWGDFVKAMANDATVIPSQLGSPQNLTDLMDLEVQKAIAAVGTSISGQLQAADLNIPLGGLDVFAQNTVTGEVDYAVSLNDGSFVFDQVSAGTYQLSVNGYQLTSNVTVTVNDGQAVTGVGATIASAPGIQGQVLLAANNQPVIGAHVQAYGTSGTEFDGYTDANGNFDLAGLPPDTYTLQVDATGLARSVVENLTITAATGPSPQAISMVPEGVIAGSLTLPSGGQSGGTLTVAADLEGGTDLTQEYTAEFPGGTSFSLNGLPAGVYDLSIDLDGYLPQTVTGITVTSGATANPGAIVMVPVAVVSGTFTSTDAASPAANAQIGAFDATGNLVDSTAADASGNFSFTDLPAGTYTIGPVDSPDLLTTATISVVAGDNVAGVNISAAPGGTIAGTVTDASSGAALAGLTVDALAPDGSVLAAVTDATGAFSFAHLGLGSYSVYLDESAGGASSYQTVTIVSLDGAPVTANLQAVTGATLSGTLIQGGNPVANAVVDLYLAGQLVATAQTGTDGGYNFGLLQPGSYDVVASANGVSFTSMTGLAVASGAIVKQDLTAGTASWQITVTDSQDVTGAIVDLQQNTPDGTVDVGSVAVGGDGVAQFSNLAEGSYTAVVTNSNNRGASSTTTLTKGQSTKSSVPLAAQGSLSGFVTDQSSVVIAGAILAITLEGSTKHYYATSASDGSYSFQNLPPGTYDIGAFAPGFSPLSKTGVAVNGGTTLNLTLKSTASKIKGTLDDWQGHPVAGALVTVTDASGNVLGQDITAADGTYLLKGPEGNGLSVSFEARGVVYQDKTSFDVTPGTTVSLKTLDLPPLVGQALIGTGVVLLSGPTKPPVTQQAWLKILPATLQLKANYKPDVNLQPCTDANGNEPCQDQRIKVQDAESEYFSAEAEFESGYKISLQKSDQLREEFLSATSQFVGLIAAYDKIESQMALVEQQIAGSSQLYRDTYANLQA
ncbi:MAG TPA: carboxypeptidase regulatory-like domain-containing protein, partial [Pirellulales bacterium]|nr:carboxypeptidase regulatory-like domain-containing protein [Pirellulales bacterium]